jgi:hypothetical protein
MKSTTVVEFFGWFFLVASSSSSSSSSSFLKRATRPDATRPDATRRVFATDEGTEEKDSLPAAIQIGDDDEVERVVEIGWRRFHVRTGVADETAARLWNVAAVRDMRGFLRHAGELSRVFARVL